MADLFDMSVAGYGFHITGHLLALIALIIASLAIAGHISFRNDSVPASALKTGSTSYPTLRMPITASPAGATRTDVFAVRQPANTRLVSIFQRVTDAFTVTNGQTLQIQVGTTRTGADLVAQDGYRVNTNQPIGAPQNDTPADFGTLVVVESAANFTNVDRDIFVQLAHSAGAITAANAGEILMMFDFYEMGDVATPL